MRTEILCLTLVAIALGPSGCKPKPRDSYQGYIEGEYVYVAPALPGTLTTLHVKRGDQVQKDQILFELEQDSERAAVEEADKRLAQAKSRRENLLKGKRPSEVAVHEAKIKQAKIALELAEVELQRRERVQKNGTGAISLEQLEQARAQRDANLAQLEVATAERETATLPGRDDEVRAAEAEIEALTASLTRARWSTDQKQRNSPVAGQVHDTVYRPGEWVASGNPVVSILPAENLKVRFFIPQVELPNFKVGQKVNVTFDGGANPVPATINYISTQAEFTPPVIYSQENRSKLIFMLEASLAPTDAKSVRPGQPVDVGLAGK